MKQQSICPTEYGKHLDIYISIIQYYFWTLQDLYKALFPEPFKGSFEADNQNEKHICSDS